MHSHEGAALFEIVLLFVILEVEVHFLAVIELDALGAADGLFGFELRFQWLTA